MADLHAHLPAIDARLLQKRLSLEAERRRAEGGDVGHGALMADALVDTVLGRDGAMERGGAGPRRDHHRSCPIPARCRRSCAHRGVRPCPARGGEGAAAGSSCAAATGAAHDGPDPFGERRAQPLVPPSVRLFTHPTTGELVAVESRGRAFPSALAKFLTWRDTSCRGPFCNAQSRQNDHIKPYARGGPTSLDNGQDGCAHCNQKENDALSVECVDDADNPGHQVAWTGYSGVTRVTAPTPLSRPPRPSPADAQSPDPAGQRPDDHRAKLTRTQTQHGSRPGTHLLGSNEGDAAQVTGRPGAR